MYNIFMIDIDIMTAILQELGYFDEDKEESSKDLIFEIDSDNLIDEDSKTQIIK